MTTALRLNLDDVDFARLTELGHSLIAGLAPEWTDRNVHDPGVMCLELLAHVADTQVYCTSRITAHERLAYAKLLGVCPRGPVSARGLVWPEMPASGPPVMASGVLQRGTEVTADRPLTPRFVLEDKVALMEAQLVRVLAHSPGDGTRDLTSFNRDRSTLFEPFGRPPRRDAALELCFQGAPFPGADPTALVALGFDAAGGDAMGDAHFEALSSERSRDCAVPRVRVMLRDKQGQRALRVVRDTTVSLMRSGVMLLAPPHGSFVDDEYSIVLRCSGFLAVPRLRRIRANVLPIVQSQAITEVMIGRAEPDQEHRLSHEGLVNAESALSLELLTWTGPESIPWQRVEDLASARPSTRAFVFDPKRQTIRCGNGLNGRMPEAGETISIQYMLSSGARGNLPAGVGWSVEGFLGSYGKNVAAIRGGQDAVEVTALRAQGREVARVARPLVTSTDLEQAALAQRDLAVLRAAEISYDPEADAPGTRRLVVVGSASLELSGDDRALWREQLRRRLGPRLVLGQRLEVVEPRFVEVSVRARLHCAASMNPSDVSRAAKQRLTARLQLLPSTEQQSVWAFGRDLSLLAVKGWLRTVPGVARVVSVELLVGSDERSTDLLSLGPLGLPSLVLADVHVERAPSGGGP